MEGRSVDGAVRLGGDAIERFHRSRGIGRPTSDGGLDLAWEEAAYLLVRGDLDAVDGLDRAAFLETAPDSRAIARLLAYRDLRERGYYVAIGPVDDAADLLVRPRGAEPTGDDVAYAVRVLRESTSLAYDSVTTGTLAIVDDETEVTYIEIDEWEPAGGAPRLDVDRHEGRLLGDRVFLEDGDSILHDRRFFGRPIDDLNALVLNLLEARYLVANGWVDVAGGVDAIVERAQRIEGDAFERRYLVYATLRDAGLVPRSGLKFGADFRVYDGVESAAEPGHSAILVAVEPIDATTSPMALSRAVRLATGVRKRQVFALVGDGAVAWRTATRLTP